MIYMNKLVPLRSLLLKTLLLPLILLTGSCKKEFLSLSKSIDDSVIQAEAGVWIKENKPALDKDLNWQMSKEIFDGKGNSIFRVPINETTKGSKVILRTLTFEKDSLDKILGHVYKIIVDTAYIATKKLSNKLAKDKRDLIQNKDFTGEILLFSIHNQFIKGQRFSLGRLISTIESKQKGKSNFKVLMGGDPNAVDLPAPGECDSPSDVCGNYTPGGGGYAWENNLHEVAIISPITYPTVPSYFGDISTIGIGSSGSNTGGGGNGGATGSPAEAAAAFMQNIDDSELNECFKKVLSEMKNAQPSGIGNFIILFSGSQPGYNWVLKNGNNLNVNGSTSPYDTQNKNITTHFTIDNFKNGSDLAVAKTILHESIHAYMVTYFKLDNIAAQKSYPQIVEDYLNDVYISYNSAQHNEMVRNYISDIASNLRAYGKSKGYQLTDQFYNDLSWGGLTETNAFLALSSSERERIKNVIWSEQSGKDIYGNPKTPKGSIIKCQ
jgi:hypothetical protein